MPISPTSACFPLPPGHLFKVGDRIPCYSESWVHSLHPLQQSLFPSNTFLFIYIFMYCIFLYKKCSAVALERATATLDLRSSSCWRDPPSRMRLASSPVSQVCWCLSGVLKVYTTLYKMAYLVFVFSKLEIFKLPTLLWDDIWLEILYMAWDWRCGS